MTKSTEQLLEQVMQLPEAERIELVDHVLERVDPSDDPEYLADWEAEIRARIADIESGEVTMVPWEQVRDELGQSVE